MADNLTTLHYFCTLQASSYSWMNAPEGRTREDVADVIFNSCNISAVRSSLNAYGWTLVSITVYDNVFNFPAHTAQLYTVTTVGCCEYDFSLHIGGSPLSPL